MKTYCYHPKHINVGPNELEQTNILTNFEKKCVLTCLRDKRESILPLFHHKYEISATSAFLVRFKIILVPMIYGHIGMDRCTVLALGLIVIFTLPCPSS